MQASNNMNQRNGKMNGRADERRLFTAPPADYFEQLPDAIMQRLPRREAVAGPERNVWRRWVPAMAALLLLAVVGWWMGTRHSGLSAVDRALQKWTVEDEILYNWEDDDLLMEEVASADNGETSYLIN